MAKIVYTTCEIQKNDSRVQYKMADNLNYMCTELNTDADSNQTKKGGPLNENGVVDQGQLRTVFETAFGGGEKNAFSSIYQLKQFLNNFVDLWGFVIKSHGNSIKYQYGYINDRQAE